MIVGSLDRGVTQESLTLLSGDVRPTIAGVCCVAATRVESILIPFLTIDWAVWRKGNTAITCAW
jgi:hypothetical protein